MRARVIPFPSLVYQREKLAEGRQMAADATGRVLEVAVAPQLVLDTEAPAQTCETQRQAMSIVQQVRQELQFRRPPSGHRFVTLTANKTCRQQAPMVAPPQLDTPLLVARRLMHYLLSAAETA